MHCDFELNTCNYQLISSHGASFKVLKANSILNHRPNTPIVDHTYHAFDGGFLELNDAILNNQYAILAAKHAISPYNLSSNETINHICVHFWYVMNGEAMNWLNISSLATKNGSIQTAYRLEGTYGPTWRHKSVQINFYDDFYLYFIGSSSNFSNGVLALDDISVTVGFCPREALCDFSVDSCGWDNNISLPLHWQIQSEYKLNLLATIFNSTTSTIINDHTARTQYGQYMYLNVSSYDSAGQTAQLISPIQPPSKKCLQYWYYFYGKNIGSFNVYIVYNQLVTLKYLLKS